MMHPTATGKQPGQEGGGRVRSEPGHGAAYWLRHPGPAKAKYWSVIGAIAAGAGLFVASLHHYLLFHALAEIFTIIVACGIFAVTWNAREFLNNNYLRFIGAAYLFVGGIDLVHTMAYEGMPMFQEYGANLATQLWVLARFFESCSLLVAPLFFRRRFRLEIVLAVLAVLSTLAFLAIFRWEIFPVCFVPGQGLTTFKVVSEYVICAILLAAMAGLLKHRDRFEPGVLKLVLWSIVFTMGSEIMFTFYVTTYGFSNLVGHYLKIVSFYLMYRAIIETGFTQPYSLLLRELNNEQEQLRESEQRFRQLAENIREVFWLWEPGEPGRILYVSPAFESVWGVRPDEAYANPAVLWELVHPEDRGFVRRAFASFTEGRGEYDLEYRITRRDGTTRWIRDRGFALRNTDNSVYRAAGIAQDVTQLKFDRAREAQLVQEIRDFAYIVSHDLRAPLVNLRGFSGELKSALEQVKPAVQLGLPLLPEEIKSAAQTAFHVDIPESLEFIWNAVHRMDHLIAAILNLSRIGHRALEPARLNVNDIVQATLETLAFQISQHGVSVTVGNLPEIVADRTAMEQIFANLLANAINYLDPNRTGEIHVDGQHLCHETVFRVRDNGVGVSADHLESIFQVFQRAGSHNVPGEGMGLAYVRTLVRRHGGRIWCESQPGEGSTFIFTVSDHVLEETVIVPEG